MWFRTSLFFSIFWIINAEFRIAPVKYSIEISANFEAKYFDGFVRILINIREAISEIELDTKNLVLSATSVSIFGHPDEIGHTIINGNKTTFQFEEELIPHIYVFEISYTGLIQDQTQEGFYISKYINDLREESIFGLTNLRNNQASLLFPCFDDAKYPAKFSFSIIRPNEYTALTSTPKISEEQFNETFTQDFFETTPIDVPTHLIAIGIFNFQESLASDDETVFMYSHKYQDINLFQSTTNEIITDLYKMPYNFDKIHINEVILPDYSLPGDFIENFGIIFYRESSTLISEGKISTKEKQWLFQMIAYALSKQFSIMVTVPLSWNQYWLTEGISGVLLHDLGIKLKDTWKLSDQFIVDEVNSVLDVDYNNGAIILESDEFVNNQPFYFIKATIILKMLIHYTGDDIINIINNPVIRNWGSRAGYPLINVMKNSTIGDLTASQRKFPDGEKSDWEIRTTFATEMFEFEINITEEAIVPLAPNHWFIANKEQLGYSRVNYDEENWKLLINYLGAGNFDRLSAKNRAQLIADSFALANNGLIDYTIYLELIKYIQLEEDFIPLSLFFKTTRRLNVLLSRSSVQESFKLFVSNLVKHLYDIYGPVLVVNEPHLNRLNRIQVMNWLCEFGYEKCTDNMFSLLSSYSNIHPDLQESAYCGGMAIGSIREFVFLATQFKLFKKDRLLKGMGCTSETDLIMYYLQAIVGNSPIFVLNAEEGVKGFEAIYSGSENGANLALAFVVNHFSNFTNSYNEEEISVMLTGLSRYLVTDMDIEKLTALNETLGLEESEKYQEIIEDAITIIEDNIDWRENYLSIINNWLNPSTTDTTVTSTPPLPNTTSSVEVTTQGSSGFAPSVILIISFLVLYLRLV